MRIPGISTKGNKIQFDITAIVCVAAIALFGYGFLSWKKGAETVKQNEEKDRTAIKSSVETVVKTVDTLQSTVTTGISNLQTQAGGLASALGELKGDVRSAQGEISKIQMEQVHVRDKLEAVPSKTPQ